MDRNRPPTLRCLPVVYRIHTAKIAGNDHRLYGGALDYARIVGAGLRADTHATC